MAYDERTRALVVTRRLVELPHWSAADVQATLGVSPSCQARILARWQQDGSLATWQGQHASDPPNKKCMPPVAASLSFR